MLAHRSPSASRVLLAAKSTGARPTRGAVVACRASFLTKLFGGGDSMGAANSSPAGASSSMGGGKGVSRLGFPLSMSAEEREAAARKLTPLQRNVALEHGTERAFTGRFADGSNWDEKRRGTYVCALSGLPLFSSDAKFDSGTGWPSFHTPISPDHVELRVDRSIPWMPRTEVLDARSGAHLGHVFPDGPRPSGQRFCMNAAALRFVPEGEPLPLAPVAKGGAGGAAAGDGGSKE